MKTLKPILFVLLMGLFLSVGSLQATEVTPAIQQAFKQLYPDVEQVTWDSKHDYSIACFSQNDNQIYVWFNKEAAWIMTETNVENTLQIPDPVREAFNKSLMSGFPIAYIRIITFPKHPTVIVIDSTDWTNNQEYQQFYAPDGTLLQNLSGMIGEGEIYPGLFE